ncbi:MAG: hypothetical protein KDJ52_34395, partial [Anaerolineae bacterium]|nr:hypothetical protein [Anaerolineae bacterium]
MSPPCYRLCRSKHIEKENPMTQTTTARSLLDPIDSFAPRHLGPRPAAVAQMLAHLEIDSLDALIEQTVPAAIRLTAPLNLPPPRSESEVIADLRAIAAHNQLYRSFIGMGYANCLVPPVIQRNILENPGWYTQ